MMSKFSVLLVLSACVLGGCGGSGDGGSGDGDSGPADAIEEFLQLVNEGNCQEAMAMIGGDLLALGNEMLQAVCVQRVQEMSQRGCLVSVDIVAQTVQGNIATVSTLTRYGDGTTNEQDNVLTRLDGAWRITPSME